LGLTAIGPDFKIYRGTEFTRSVLFDTGDAEPNPAELVTGQEK